jgi:4-hydroxybenzoate polyprenyltransferase
MLSYLILKAKTPNDFHQASTLIKVIMLIGILYSLVFYYLQAKSNGFTFFNLIIPN